LYVPAGTTRPKSSRPSQTNLCGPAGRGLEASSVRTTFPCESTTTTLRRSAFRVTNWTGILRNWQWQRGPSSFPTCVRRTGLRSSFRCSVYANAAAVPPSSPATTSAAATRARRPSDTLDIPDEDEGLGELATDGRAVELGVRAQRAVVARVWIVAALGLEARECLQLAVERRRHVDEPVRHEPVRRSRSPLRARRRRVGEHPPHRLARRRPRCD